MFDFHRTDDSERHIAQHRVTPEEVEQSASRPFYTMTGRNGTTLLFGQPMRAGIYKKKAR